MATMAATNGSRLSTDVKNGTMALAEFHGEEPDCLNLSMWDIFENTASIHPDREAVVSMWQSPSSPRVPSNSSSVHQQDSLRWNYRDLLEKSGCVAISLERLGCRRGMRLGAILWNSAEWALFFWAAAKLGMVFAPIDPRDPYEAQDVLASLKPDVIVVQDATGAALVNGKRGSLAMSAICIQCSEISEDGWIPATDVVSAGETIPSPAKGEDVGDEPCRDDQVASDDTALIIFTSGTTGQPKGCPHSNRNLMSQTYDYDPNLDAAFVDRWLVHTPVSHIFAVNNALRSWRYGGTVIFPSKSFDVEATAQALVQEQCTIMSATPTLVKTLLAHSRCPRPQDLNLSVVSIAATKITPEDIRLCREELGARDVVQAFGMSEGAPLVSWSRRDELFRKGSDLGAGRVLPGASIRVCHPTSCRILAIQEVGELHVSGSSVISSYLDQVRPNSFYDDAHGRWFATGDQAIINEDGVVQILGRYKDIIIRGGENLNPTTIEEVLCRIPGVQAWVIGVPDDLAGEVPVAVAQLPQGLSKARLYERATSLSPKYALAGIYTLDELQLESVPKTSIGKVKKERLKAVVGNFRVQEKSAKPSDQTCGPSPVGNVSEDSVARLVDIWEGLTGSRPCPTTSMAHIADSITLLRYCDAVFRSCGKRLYFQDVVEHDTIERQARLLGTRDNIEPKQRDVSHRVSANRSGISHPPSPPPDRAEPNVVKGLEVLRYSSRKQSFRASDDVDLLKVKALAVLSNVGLGPSSVEDIFPIRESFHRMVVGQRPQSYHLRIVFRVRNTGSHQIRRGVEMAIAHRPLMRAILLRSARGELHHAVIEASQDLFDKLISGRDVECETYAKECWQDDSGSTHSSQLMFQAEIISVRESGNKYISMLFNHSVVDALSLWTWHRDLDVLIDDAHAQTWETTPFKLFSDLFARYETSTPAKEAVSFHVRRLRGISRLRQALWPKQRAPGWMISNDCGSKHSSERDHVRNEVWNGEWKARESAFRYPRLGRVVRLPQLRKLKERGIEPSLFARSAIVIFNVLKTGQSHAVFNTWESGRSWPFVLRWMEEMLPPAMSIDGPTVEWILNMIEVAKDEPIISFLQRMVAESEEMKRYEHVPWQKVVEELRDEGDVAIDASFRQSFVWDVSLGMSALRGKTKTGDCRRLEPVARLDWADCGLFWNAFMVDHDNLYFVASWDTAQMNDAEVDACCELLADVMRKLGDEGNWEKSVGDVFQS